MNRRLFLIFAFTLVSCAGRPTPLPFTEAVLTDGMRLSAETHKGKLTVIGGPGTERTFVGAGWQRSTHLIPRRTRWYGSLGLYDPSKSRSLNGRVIVDEGKLFFDSESDALRFLYVGSSQFKPVFTSTGLAIGYHVMNIPGGEPTRSIRIWQIYIMGKRPSSLRGAADEKITVTGGDIQDRASPNEAPVGYEMTLGRREYIAE